MLVDVVSVVCSIFFAILALFVLVLPSINRVGKYFPSFGINDKKYGTMTIAPTPNSTPLFALLSAEKNTTNAIIHKPNTHQQTAENPRFFANRHLC